VAEPLVRIKRLILVQRVIFTAKAEGEMFEEKVVASSDDLGYHVPSVPHQPHLGAPATVDHVMVRGID
jgi:uncharacterized RmlC-like cupin family protein